MTEQRPALPAMLSAGWQRTLMVHADGRRDTGGWVLWLQHGDDFCDLRQPDARPDILARNLAELTPAEMRGLAGQNGFAGRLAFDGTFYEWQREIAFQPAGPTPDAAALYFEDETLVEIGRHEPYREDWIAHPQPASPPGLSQRLRDEAGRAMMLVRRGELFMLARDRASPLAPGGTLLEQLDAAADDLARRDLLDCEISFGRVTEAGWRIERSTLPWREGRTVSGALPHRSASRLDPAGACD